MTHPTTPRRLAGLSDLAPAYRGVMCDVWGVLHNGVAAFEGAVAALTRYREAGGRVVLVTNAPRRKPYVQSQLDGLGVSRAAYDDIVTSGGAARERLAERAGARLFHLGPDVHLHLYDDLAVDLVDEEACDVISCTGPFDDTIETPEDYRPRLERWQARGVPMLCANPDILIDRGGRLVYCAGALAKLYEELGGEVEIVGKPYGPIYGTAMKRLADVIGGPVERGEVLAIGDGAETDVRGANGQGLDVLFVTDGVHAAEFGARGAPDHDAVARFLDGRSLSAVGYLPELAW